MSEILNRIKQIIDYKHISFRNIERQINASNGMLSTAYKNSTDIQSKWLVNILKTFPEIDANWLLLGKGSMLLEKSNMQKNNDVIKEETPQKIKDLLDKIETLNKELLQLYKEIYILNKQIQQTRNS